MSVYATTCISDKKNMMGCISGTLELEGVPTGQVWDVHTYRNEFYEQERQMPMYCRMPVADW